MADLPPLPERRRGFFCTKCHGHECVPETLKDEHPLCLCGYMGFAQDLDFTADQLRSFAEEAVKHLSLPKSYGGSTFSTWGDQKEGCTVRLHFTDAKAAEEWVNRLTDNWDAAIRARSSMESRDV